MPVNIEEIRYHLNIQWKQMDSKLKNSVKDGSISMATKMKVQTVVENLAQWMKLSRCQFECQPWVELKYQLKVEVQDELSCCTSWSGSLEKNWGRSNSLYARLLPGYDKPARAFPVNCQTVISEVNKDVVLHSLPARPTSGQRQWCTPPHSVQLKGFIKQKRERI